MSSYIIKMFFFATTALITMASYNTEKYKKKKKNEANEAGTDNTTKIKRKPGAWQPDWLLEPEFKDWLQDTGKPNRFLCIYCNNEYYYGQKSDISRHLLIKSHNRAIAKAKEENLYVNIPIEPGLIFMDKVKMAELRISRFISENEVNVLFVNKFMKFIQYLSAEFSPQVINKIELRRDKCSSIIKKVLYPSAFMKTVEKLNSTNFAVLIDESTDIGLNKILCVSVQYFDLETNEVKVHLLQLLQVNALKATAEGIFNVVHHFLIFYNINPINIVALASDTASVMTGPYGGFIFFLKKISLYVILVPCTCHILALIAKACMENFPAEPEKLIRLAASYFSHSSKRCKGFTEFLELWNLSELKMLKLSGTRWLEAQKCFSRLEKVEPALIEFLENEVKSDNKNALGKKPDSVIKTNSLDKQSTVDKNILTPEKIKELSQPSNGEPFLDDDKAKVQNKTKEKVSKIKKKTTKPKRNSKKTAKSKKKNKKTTNPKKTNTTPKKTNKKSKKPDSKKATEADQISKAQQLLDLITNPEVMAEVYFLSYILGLFNSFNATYQSSGFLIHKLYNQLQIFCLQIGNHFLNQDAPKSSLFTADFDIDEYCLPLEQIDLGFKCNEHLKKQSPEVQLKVRQNCLNYLKTAIIKTREKFSGETEFLKSFLFIEPNVALNFSERAKVPEIRSFSDKYDFIDSAGINYEWSHLASAYELRPIEKKRMLSLNAVQFWSEIVQLPSLDGDGILYPNLTKLMKIVFAFPHSNSEPERVFSEVNRRKNDLSNRTGIELLNSRIFLNSFGRAYDENAMTFEVDTSHFQLYNSNNMYGEKKKVRKKNEKDVETDTASENDIYGTDTASESEDTAADSTRKKEKFYCNYSEPDRNNEVENANKHVSSRQDLPLHTTPEIKPVFYNINEVNEVAENSDTDTASETEEMATGTAHGTKKFNNQIFESGKRKEMENRYTNASSNQNSATNTFSNSETDFYDYRGVSKPVKTKDSQSSKASDRELSTPCNLKVRKRKRSHESLS